MFTDFNLTNCCSQQDSNSRYLTELASKLLNRAEGFRLNFSNHYCNNFDSGLLLHMRLSRIDPFQSSYVYGKTKINAANILTVAKLLSSVVIVLIYFVNI